MVWLWLPEPEAAASGVTGGGFLAGPMYYVKIHSDWNSSFNCSVDCCSISSSLFSTVVVNSRLSSLGLGLH